MVEPTGLIRNKRFWEILEDYASGKIDRVYANVLTASQEGMLRYYTTEQGYKKLNAVLRGDILLTDELLAEEELMKIALNKLPVSKFNSSESLLYRIGNIPEEIINKVYPVGKTITKIEFTSTTYSGYSISQMMSRKPYTVLLRIEGKTGRSIEKLSIFPEEKEILFSSQTQFFVEKITKTLSPENYEETITTIILIEK